MTAAGRRRRRISKSAIRTREDLAPQEVEFLLLLARSQDTGAMAHMGLNGVRVHALCVSRLVTNDWRITALGRALIPEHPYALHTCDGCGGDGGSPSRQYPGATLLCNSCGGTGRRYQRIPGTRSE